ncbi:MAG: glycosyltransferase family 4 protein [Thermoanaerobaculia bacterium]
MLRIDYLSPLPPVRSGISDYSVDLLPQLSALADVRVMQLPELPLDPELAARYSPADASLTGEDGRIPVYHMGNNRYHAAIFRLAMERPGILVLHDLVLHHFLLDQTVGKGEFEPYRRILRANHGWIGEAAAMPVRWGAFGQSAQFALPANRTLLRRQRGVVVHGHWAAAVLSEEDPELAVRVVPMGIPLPQAIPEGSGRAFRSDWQIPPEALLLGSFGFQTPIKRTEVAIRVLAEPGLEGVHLLIAGELSPYSNYETLARELGVAERVHVTGYLPFEKLDAAIAATDLCLNLRYPTAGETSASLLRILAVGRPVAVSDYADFGDLPHEIALHVPLGDGEMESLAQALRERMAMPELLHGMGLAARRFVGDRHAPSLAAAALVAAIDELAPRAPLEDREPLPGPGGTAVHVRVPGRIEVRGVDDWAPGERRELRVEVRNESRYRWLPSHELPGGVIFEVQLFAAGRDIYRGRPWLSLPQALEPGESRTFALELRRPDGAARLLIKPTLHVEEGHRPLGAWEWDRWL